MTPKVLVILGSGREESDTMRAVNTLCPFTSFKLLDLRQMNIKHYTYDHTANQGDDFKDVVKEIDAADILIFATPVYWYAMSGLMKVLFDRFTELLSTYKEVGKRLKGKRCYLISCGTDATLPEGFEIPFILTARYFEMRYETTFYHCAK